MRYICTDEHKMWPQHSVRKWEVRKANMTGNNLLQKNQTKPNQMICQTALSFSACQKDCKVHPG